MRSTLIATALVALTGAAMPAGAGAVPVPPRQACVLHQESTWMSRPLALAIDSVSAALEGTVQCGSQAPFASTMTMLISQVACGVGEATGRLEILIGEWHSATPFVLDYAGAEVALILNHPFSPGTLVMRPTTNLPGQCMTGMTLDGAFVWHSLDGTTLDDP